MKELEVDIVNLLGQVRDGASSPEAFTGRETGRRLREALAAVLLEEEGEAVLYLDFGRAGVMDYSCADEFLGKLLPRVLADEFGPKFISLKDLSTPHMENIAVALERRELAVAAKPRGGPWTFLGKLNPYLRETFRLVYDWRRVSSRELSERLRLALNTGSTRLINLYKKRLVGRHEAISPNGFREYVYESFSGGFSLA